MPRRLGLRRAAVASFAWLALVPSARAQTPIQAAWVELSPTGPVVRLITSAEQCPRVAPTTSPVADDAPDWRAAMQVREPPEPPNFPNHVCEWAPSPRTRFVAIEGWPNRLRMPVPDPHRIVAFGDSGCLGGQYGQDCSPQNWSFADIARLAAARNPDLVIHLGDYNYRGTECVAYDACCTYNPINCGFPDCGDNWENWNLDFFTPAAPLLEAAPWVMVRGNHELCSRGGRGYFRYLDPHATMPTCAANPVIDPTYTEPYALDLGPSLRLLVIDSANACGEPAERDNIAPYRRQFAVLNQLAAGGQAQQTWLVSHKPMWGILRATSNPPTVLDYTLQSASGNRVPAPVNLVLSGHEHLFQSLTMTTPGAPSALLIGGGGAELDDPSRLPGRLENVGTGPNGPTIGVAVTVHDHGYLVIDQDAGAWTAKFYDRYDQPLAFCDSSSRPSICTAVRP